MKKYLFLIGIFAVIYFITVKYNHADWDLWARLAVGSVFYHTGTVLKHDIFAYTPTKSLWVDHEWGSGVIFYYLSHYFGDAGLLGLKFALLLGIFFLVFKTNEMRSNNSDPYRIGYYVLLIYAMILAFDGIIRSQSFTYFFFALWLYLLDKVRMGHNRLIWLFPATMIVWANLHGGFLAGLGIVIAYGAGEAINRRSFAKYFLIFGLSALSTLINPYGLSYWTFIANAVTMNRPYVTEWDPLNLFGPLTQLLPFKLWVTLTAFSLPYLFIKRLKEINWSEIAILAITFYMSLKHRRHVIFFIIASASYLYFYLYPAFDWYTRNALGKFYSFFSEKLCKVGRALRSSAVYGVIFSLCFLALVLIPPKVKANDNLFPTRAVKFIQMNRISGNLLVLFNWGSYALWKLYPQCLVAVDGRYEEVYPAHVINDMVRFHYVGENWDGLLRNYHADIMLIPISYQDLYKKILTLNDWKQVYKDNVAAVFLPKEKANQRWVLPPKNFDATKEKFISDVQF